MANEVLSSERGGEAGPLKVPPTKPRSLGVLWGKVWRVAAGAVLAAILLRGAVLLSLTIFAHSDYWDLPNGELLQTVLSSCQVKHTRREDVVSEQMICPIRVADYRFPSVLRDAVVAGEDRRFFSHSALDFRSTVRAAWSLLSGYREGGSTITQQLSRSLLLEKEASFERKLLEAVLAIRIYAYLSREEILTRYMNVVPHARSMYGFDDPARYYFGVGVEDLTLAEAALLVGMLPEPNNRDPERTPDRAFNGAVAVLERMRVQNKISAEQFENAKTELARRVLGRNLRRGKEIYARIEYRPYRDLALREARANGIETSNNHRLILFIHPEFQQRLTKQLCAIASGHQAAGFFMQPGGEVLATAGSCTYSGEWNRATDIERSIGSAGKLFPLIGVHEAGIGLWRRAATRPLRRSGWPRESSSRCVARTSATLRYALDHSCNRPWAAVSGKLGSRVRDIVGRFGLKAPEPATLVPLGGIHTSPMKLAQSYAVLRNGGALPDVRYLAAAIGPKGEVLGVPSPKREQRIVQPDTASAVLKALRGPVRRGTARAANSKHALVYGKTGTSSRNVDAVFVGLTRDFVGSLWLGRDRPSPMRGVSGGGAPAKAFSRLTDFYYIRLAQARYVQNRKDRANGGWGQLKSYAPRKQAVYQLAMLGSMSLASFLLAALLASRRKTPGPGARSSEIASFTPRDPTEPHADAADRPHQRADVRS